MAIAAEAEQSKFSSLAAEFKENYFKSIMQDGIEVTHDRLDIEGTYYSIKQVFTDGTSQLAIFVKDGQTAFVESTECVSLKKLITGLLNNHSVRTQAEHLNGLRLDIEALGLAYGTNIGSDKVSGDSARVKELRELFGRSKKLQRVVEPDANEMVKVKKLLIHIQALGNTRYDEVDKDCKCCILNEQFAGSQETEIIQMKMGPDDSEWRLTSKSCVMALLAQRKTTANPFDVNGAEMKAEHFRQVDIRT